MIFKILYFRLYLVYRLQLAILFWIYRKKFWKISKLYHERLFLFWFWKMVSSKLTINIEIENNFIASAWFYRCRLYSRVASSRPKCLVLWSFFSSRICSVPSFRVSSLPKPGFIVIPHSLVANRRNKTWKLFFSTHTNKKYSSLQTNFPPKTRIKLLKKT